MKKLVPKYLSVSSMVTAPANTGITAISRNAVMTQVQTNRGSFIMVIPGARMFNTVVMMLIAAMIEEIPRIWMVKMVKGKLLPVCSTSGG